MEEAWTSRSILVTGGLGFLGLNTVKALLDVGATVRVLTRSIPPLAQSWLSSLAGNRPVEVVAGDVGDSQPDARWLDGVDGIVHLGGESGAAWSLDRPARELHNNVEAQLFFLDALRKCRRPPHVVFLSSRLVYGTTGGSPVSERSHIDPTSLYAAHKLTVENYLRVYRRTAGLPWTILRATNPFGPFQSPDRLSHGFVNRFVFSALSGRPLVVFGDGAQLRDVLHVEDLSRAILMSLASPVARGEVFNVGRGESIAFVRIAREVSRLIPGSRIVFEPWPDSERRVETGDFRCSISKIRRKLGWRPTIGLRAGLRRTVDDYRTLLGDSGRERGAVERE